jgi:hypothetical protein
MSRPISLQVYVSAELANRVRAAASANGLGISEWLRTQVVRACDGELSTASDRAVLTRLYRQSLFGFVGLDALLAGHPDHGLRERVHSAWKARCKEAGMAITSKDGGAK